MTHQSSPMISVIMPVHNCERYVEQAVKSIVGQTYERWELIIWDDGSSDKSFEILEELKTRDPRIAVYRNAHNVGKVETVRKALQLCKGSYVTVHDADDFSHPLRFEKQLDFLLTNPDYRMCGCAFISLDRHDREMSRVRMPTEYAEIQKNIHRESQFHGPTMVIDAAIIDSIGGLYRYFRNKEDVDLAVRLVEKYKAANLPDFLYYYRNIPSSLSKWGYDFLKFEGLKLINLLAEERKLNGIDSLMTNNHQKIEEYLAQIRQPYDKDKSLFYRKAAAHSLYFNFYKNALIYALRGILAEPLKIITYREFLYVLRKYIQGLISSQ